MSLFFSTRPARSYFRYEKRLLYHGQNRKNSFSIINFVPLNKYFNST
jgi:hypothetical protein